MHLGVIGLEGERLVVAGHGILQPAECREHIAQVIVCLGVIGLEVEGHGDPIDGDVILARLVGDHAQQMQSDGLVGMALQYLLVDVLRLREAASRVVLYREIYRLLDG